MTESLNARSTPYPSVQQSATDPDQGVDLTAIIVNYNTSHLLDESIGALRLSSAGMRLQVVLVDNASRDDSIAVIKERFGDCELIENHVNVGFGRANNQALPLVRGRYVLLLNTDAFVAPDTLRSTVAFMDANARCGVLGVRLAGRDGVLQPSCRYAPTPWNVFLGRTGLNRFFPGVQMIDEMSWDHASVRECDWVPGCYYLIRREVLDTVGLFDPRYFLYFEEIDHCRAVKAAGWSVVFFPHTTVVHIGGESAKSDSALTALGQQISELQIESEMLYFRKHGGRTGVWLSFALSALSDLLLSLKSALRHRTLRGAAGHFRHLAAMWSLLRRTAWATRPTR